MITLFDSLNAIKQLVMDANPFFDNGYAYARKNEDMGIVMTVAADMKQVGIVDTDGDYFYIRVSDKIGASPSKGFDDCSVSVTERTACSLVACVKDADTFALKDSVQNSLMKSNKAFITAIYIDPITIINEELKGLDKKVVNRAKSRFKNMTLVRIDFNIDRIFNSNNCVYNICPTC